MADSPITYQQWGADLDEQARRQMENACRLPVSVAAALMPDAHVGYGLPIGGVLATENAVIPYAVGVDIACRVKMTVLDLPVDYLTRKRDWLAKAIEDETRFGIGAEFKHQRRHAVMDEDWNVSFVTRKNKDRAAAQLGTSGSGNHFVEFGELTVGEEVRAGAPGENDSPAWAPVPLQPLPSGKYVALLSHSGSRGTGAAVCDHYSRVARQRHPELPKELSFLAWLDLDSAEGREYWAAMELMGRYASANHHLIHKHIAKHLGAHVLFDVENHHNFAWKETHGGREVVVHRKGATPAGAGVLGVIPGSMASPTYLVRGRGSAASLNSASHGAGRVMSRTKARESFNWKMVHPLLDERGVTLLSAGLDEVPMVYKDIDQVMAAQTDLVEPLAKFLPRVVKMAGAGEKAED
jgi:tRNA-splicing ligase RtcB